MNCGICRRALNNEYDPLSIDCGGDCLGCMISIEGDDIRSLASHIRTLQDRLIKMIENEHYV